MFGHLHCHSSFSFLQAVPSPKQLVAAVKEAGQTFFALTDSSSMIGIVDAAEAAEKEKVKLVIGIELWTIDGPERGNDEPAPGYQLVLLVRNAVGWKNLCRLTSLAHRRRNFAPRIELEQLRQHREGLHVLTGNRYGLFREEGLAEGRLSSLVDVVGADHLDVEVCDLGFDEDGPRNELAVELARKVSLPVLATNDVRYTSPYDAGVLEAMVRIATTDLAMARLSTASDQATLKTEQEMAELWPAEYLARTGEVAELCSFAVPRGKPMLPRVEKTETLRQIVDRFPPPKGFPTPDLEAIASEPPRTANREPRTDAPAPLVNLWFRWLAREGLQIRLRDEPWALKYATEEEYSKQLEFELGVIEGMDYVVYHLIVSEFTNWAHDNDVAVGPGRGSAAGSVVVWSLRITDVNPRQFGLFFERFLNPERRGLPDIDMDFEQEGRGRVIAHVREKYGDARVGQILTVGTLKAKAALKDAARICDVHFQDSNNWSGHVPEGPKVKLKDSLEHGYLASLRGGSPLFKRVSDLALALEGKPRQQGVHAAGVIIASDDLPDLCPMHYVPEDDLTCTGLAMEQAEKLGLVKFDFLGLKTLDVIKRAVASIVRRTGEVPVLTDPGFDDPAVFELLRRADTDGVFQLESAGMTQLIKRLQPSQFEDVICMLALFRPGPLKAGMVDSWVERRHGREPVDSIHPLLDEIMAPTYGLMVYQEQAIMTARILAGFSLGNADLLRRAIGKKKADEMAAQRAAFVKGCWETNQVPESEADRIFGLIDYFSGYSFNKAHSAAYAVVSYMTAKLKAYHRADFVAASMTLDMANRDKIRHYVASARRAKIRVLRPDVNRSEAAFTEEGGAVRFGLGAVKGVGDAVLPKLLANRPYTSSRDLLDRGGVSKAVAETLVWAGALDSVEPDRFESWWTLKRPPRKAPPKKFAAEQILLFGGGKTAGEERAEREEKAELEAKPQRPTLVEVSDKEVAALGVTLGEHPLKTFEDVASRVRTHSIDDLSRLGPERVPFVLVARVEAASFDEDRRGEPVAFVTLEDGIGLLEVVVRSDALRSSDKELTMVQGACIAVHGTADAFDPDHPRVMVDRLEPLPEFRWRIGRTLELEVKFVDRELLPKIRSMLDEAVGGGTHEVVVLVETDGEPGKLLLDRKVRPTDGLATSLERLCGRPNVLRLPRVTTARSEVVGRRSTEHQEYDELSPPIEAYDEENWPDDP